MGPPDVVSQGLLAQLLGWGGGLHVSPGTPKLILASDMQLFTGEPEIPLSRCFSNPKRAVTHAESISGLFMLLFSH